jgi:hypothetical protein
MVEGFDPSEGQGGAREPGDTKSSEEFLDIDDLILWGDARLAAIDEEKFRQFLRENDDMVGLNRLCEILKMKRKMLSVGKRSNRDGATIKQKGPRTEIDEEIRGAITRMYTLVENRILTLQKRLRTLH